MTSSDPWLTLPQLEERQPAATVRWLRRLVASRSIPHAKCGGKVLVRESDWIAFVEEAMR